CSRRVFGLVLPYGRRRSSTVVALTGRDPRAARGVRVARGGEIVAGGRSRGRAPKPGAGWSGRRVLRLTRLVLESYGDTCHLCARAGATTADHLIPRSLGGDDSLENLRPAHSSCNSARQAMPLEEWFARHPLDLDPRVPPSREW